MDKNGMAGVAGPQKAFNINRCDKKIMPIHPSKSPANPKHCRTFRKALAVAWCAFTFIQCSDHYGLESGTWNGEKPKATYQGEAKVNGKKPGKRFRLPYASGVVGNDKAFIKPEPTSQPVVE